MLRMLVVAAHCACAAPALSADASVVGFGAVELHYDPAAWTLERDGSGEVARFVSMPDWRDTVVVAVEIVPAEGEGCDLAGERERLDRTIRWFDMHDENYGPISVAATGLDVHGVVAELGCRNWASHSVAACVRHAGLVHHFTYLTDGCQGGPGGEEKVIDLLGGLRPAG